MLVRIVIGWGLRLGGLARRIRRDNPALLVKVGLRRRRLTGARCLCGDGVEMPKRKRELDGERKQREPRPMFDVRPEPLHADACPTPEGEDISATPVL